VIAWPTRSRYEESEDVRAGVVDRVRDGMAQVDLRRVMGDEVDLLFLE